MLELQRSFRRNLKVLWRETFKQIITNWQMLNAECMTCYWISQDKGDKMSGPYSEVTFSVGLEKQIVY